MIGISRSQRINSLYAVKYDKNIKNLSITGYSICINYFFGK